MVAAAEPWLAEYGVVERSSVDDWSKFVAYLSPLRSLATRYVFAGAGSVGLERPTADVQADEGRSRCRRERQCDRSARHRSVRPRSSKCPGFSQTTTPGFACPEVSEDCDKEVSNGCETTLDTFANGAWWAQERGAVRAHVLRRESRSFALFLMALEYSGRYRVRLNMYAAAARTLGSRDPLRAARGGLGWCQTSVQT